MITATRLTRTFGARTALAGIDLRVEKGELFGLIGPDGAGKTTFFRILAGVLAPTSGAVVVDGAAAKVTVDAFPGREFAAHITEISPEAEFTPKAVETSSERVNLVYAAKADLDRGWSEPLVPGQPAEITVTVAK